MKTPLFYLSLCIGLLSLSQCKKADPSACSAEEPCILYVYKPSNKVYYCETLPNNQRHIGSIRKTTYENFLFFYPYGNVYRFFETQPELVFYFFNKDELSTFSDETTIAQLLATPNLAERRVFKQSDIIKNTNATYISY